MKQSRSLAIIIIITVGLQVFCYNNCNATSLFIKRPDSTLIRNKPTSPPKFYLNEVQAQMIFLNTPYISNSAAETPLGILKKLERSESSTTSVGRDSVQSFWYTLSLFHGSNEMIWFLSSKNPHLKIRLFKKQKNYPDSLIEITNVGYTSHPELHKIYSSLFSLQLVATQYSTYLLNIRCKKGELTEALLLFPAKIKQLNPLSAPLTTVSFSAVAMITVIIILLLLFYLQTQQMVYLLFVCYIAIAVFEYYFFFSFLKATQNYERPSSYIFFLPSILNLSKKLLIYVINIFLINQTFKTSKLLKYYVFFLILFLGFDFNFRYYFAHFIPSPYLQFNPNYQITVSLILNILFAIAVFFRYKISPKPKIYYILLIIILSINIITIIISYIDIPYMENKYKYWGYLDNLLIAFYLVILIVRYVTYLKVQKEELIQKMLLDQKGLSEDVIEALEDDRKRIAADLHDELGGNLAAVKMQLQMLHISAEQLNPMIDLLNNTANTVRNISHNLTPPAFENRFIDEVLNDYFENLNNDINIKFNFLTKGANNQFKKTEYLIIYRIILELTYNILNTPKQHLQLYS